MKFKTAFIALAGAFLLYGCKSDNNQPVDPDSFRFIGRVYDYNGAKYEMTPGDSVGLYAAEPLSVLNRRGAYDASGYIVLNPSIYPVDGASGTTPVLAYKPYSRDYTGSEFLFVAKSDQRLEKDFKSSCFFVAITSVNPGDNSAASHLDFHPMTSQLSLYFSNLSGKAVTSVTVSGFSGTSSVNMLTGEVKVAGSKADHIGFALPDSAGVYRFNLAPQSGKPVIKVALEDSTFRTFTFTDSLTLHQGKVTSNEKSPLIIQSAAPVDPEDFGKCTTPGVYSTATGEITGTLLYNAGLDQYAVSTLSDARLFRLQNLRDGWMFKLVTSTKTLTAGASVNATVQTVGLDNVFPGEYACTVLKVQDSKAWLTCDARQVGYIISIE